MATDLNAKLTVEVRELGELNPRLDAEGGSCPRRLRGEKIRAS